MPPFDRKAALKNAEKAIKQGRVDVAIAEYVKVVEAQPRDWNSANALGDLYVRAKQIEKGVQQYTRIADHLADEGFYPKAAALYKKILKIKPDDEYSMVQSGDMAAKTAARSPTPSSTSTRSPNAATKRGDKKGATEIAIRLGTLDPEDYESRMRAAKLATESGDTTTALREYKDVAARLEKKERRRRTRAAEGGATISISRTTSCAAGCSRPISAATRRRRGRWRKSADELKRWPRPSSKAGHGDAALEVFAEIAAADPANIEIKANWPWRTSRAAT